MIYLTRYSVIYILLSLCLTSCSKEVEQVFLTEEEAMREEVKDFSTIYSDSAVVKVKFSGPVMWRKEYLHNELYAHNLGGGGVCLRQ